MNTTTVKTYLACVGITLGALLVVHAVGISYPLEVTTLARSGELSVVGEGKVEAIPDTATITAGISVDRVQTVEEAQSRIDTINNAILASMRELGIPEEDIQTSQYSVNPNYIYDTGSQRVDGYTAQAAITIETHDTELVSQIVSRATAAGANQINGIQFTIDDPAKFRSEARSKAIANAREEAKKLAKELGIQLGKVTNIVESGSPVPQPMFRQMALDTAESSAQALPEFEAGSQTITSSVVLYFEKR